MMQAIIVAKPPNWETLRTVFKLDGVKHLIFSWGDQIYLPDGGDLSPELRAHEGLHGQRQIVYGIEKWWDRYLIDVEWRLSEELLSHRAEYGTFCSLHKDRNERTVFLHYIARRLSGPIYNNMLTVHQAKAKILR